MNEPLYSFAVLRVEQAESYEQNDLKQYARRIHTQGHQLLKRDSVIASQATKIGNYEEILKGQNELIESALKRAEKERKRRIRGKRRAWLGIAAAFIGGVIIAK